MGISLWPVIILVVGIVLTQIAQCLDSLVDEAALNVLGIVLIFVAIVWILTQCFAVPEYTESARYKLKSYSLTTIDTRQESVQRCTAVLQDGSTMIVDLKEVRKEGSDVVLVQYSNTKQKWNGSWKKEYILLLPVNEPAESATQQSETTMKKTSTNPHEKRINACF